MKVYIDAVGCCAPGLASWLEAQPVLRDEQAYVRAELPSEPPPRLPANERRRAPQAVRLAFRVAEDVLRDSTHAPENLATVFASSDGDTDIVHRISWALAEPQRRVSPTDFHNSVHNAAAGYWSIAAAARLPSMSLSACHGSFAAGLLEAAALVQVEELSSLLLAFDVRPPAPLLERWRIIESAAFALILSPRRSAQSLAMLNIEVIDRTAASVMQDAGLERLRLGNPAARALPLLALLARGESGTVILDGAGEHSLNLGVSLIGNLP